MLKMSGPRMWLYVRCKSSPAQTGRPADAGSGDVPKSLNNRLVKQGITNQGALYLTSDYMKAVFGN